MHDRKIWSFFFEQAETGEKGQNVISSFTQDPISLNFAIHI